MILSNANTFHMYPIKANNARKFTDLHCCVIYLLLTILLLGAFFYSFILEKERNLFLPEDPDGNRCGEGAAADYPYIYFPVPFLESFEKTVCVKDCPRNQDSELDCLKNSLVDSCVYDVTDHFNRSNQFIVYETKNNDILRLCEPEESILFSSLNSDINTYSLFSNFQRVYDARYVIMVVCPLICLLLIGIYVLSINCVSDISFLVWPLFAAFLIICFGFGAYFMTGEAKRMFLYFPMIGILMIIVGLVLLVYTVYDRKKIRKSIALLNMGTLYIKDNCPLIFISVGSFFTWAIVFALELVIFLSIYSINEGEKTEEEKNSFAFLTSIQNNLFVNILLVLTVIHYLWTNFIIYHMNKYLSKALATNWVLRIQNPFKLAVYTMLRFHMGTIIHGAAILPFLSWISDLLFFMMPGPKGRVCCCKLQCCVDFYRGQCFQKYLAIFEELGYIRVNLEGEPLCEAGQKISPLLIQNLFYINRAYRLASFLIFSTKIVITVLTTFICWVILLANPELQSHIITMFIIFFFSLILTSFATDSYDRSFETILITILINNAHRANIKGSLSGLIALAITQNTENPAQRESYDQINEWFKDVKAEYQQENEENQ